MQHILIVEDDELQLKMLVDTISGHYPGWNVDACRTYDSALKLIKESCLDTSKEYTLFLFDVQLTECVTDRGGFQLAEEVRKIPMYYRTSILFLTGITNALTYALSTFHCYNYINKPYTCEDILNQLEQMIITGYLEQFTTIVDTDRILHKIRTEDITYVNSIRHLKAIHTTNSKIQTRDYSFDDLISMTNNKLTPCHKAYLINTRYISSYDKVTNSIVINGESIPVGRKYKISIFN